jgi:hypothetical protein
MVDSGFNEKIFTSRRYVVRDVVSVPVPGILLVRMYSTHVDSRRPRSKHRTGRISRFVQITPCCVSNSPISGETRRGINQGDLVKLLYSILCINIKAHVSTLYQDFVCVYV